ncbi:MAG: hypothetical protein JRH14_08500 [Deltaproteobacteria bacterium]|nr:hypothetical protein [Deltaproteobacteria bacterium]MBW2159992.1 hypothetical protein [Deltaproteobacteria bacterium]
MSPRTRRTLWLIMAAGIIARVTTWWFKGGFHYPDEIFQQVEPAQYLRTGVATLPWEFVRGVRSWVLPGVYAALFEVLSWMGVTGLAAFRVVTLQNAVLSIIMVPAGYRMGAALWGRDDPDAERAGLSVAFFTAFLPALVYYTPHTLNGTPCMVALAWGYAHWLEARRSKIASSRSLLLSGLFFGIAGALRFTCGLHMLVPIIDLLLRYRSQALRALVAGAALPVLIVGGVDMLTWGWPFHSTVEHLRYNFFEGGASDHGTSPWFYYLAESLWARLGPLAPLTLWVLLGGLRRTWLVALAVLVPTLALSALPHKEDRFLMYNWPLLAAAAGIGWLLIARWLRARLPSFGSVTAAALAAAVLASNLQGTLELPWTMRRGMFQAQAFVGEQDDATGLLFHDRAHMNGGYLVFDRTIPQASFNPRLVANPLFNYAALQAKGNDAQRLLRTGWVEVSILDEIAVLKRPPWRPRSSAAMSRTQR